MPDSFTAALRLRHGSLRTGLQVVSQHDKRLDRRVSLLP